MCRGLHLISRLPLSYLLEQICVNQGSQYAWAVGAYVCHLHKQVHFTWTLTRILFSIVLSDVSELRELSKSKSMLGIAKVIHTSYEVKSLTWPIQAV